jgi:hypothetical protein
LEAFRDGGRRDDVADCVGEVIAVAFLEVADDGLDGGTPFELALVLRRDVTLLAGRVDLELVFGRVPNAAAWETNGPPAECLTVMATLTLTPNS